MLNDDDHKIPHNKIICVAENPEYEKRIHEVVEPLRGRPHREELGKHSFHCLPVVIGNQYGFVIKSMVSWSAIWNGGIEPKDTKVILEEDMDMPGEQTVASHFGSGIVTVQNRFNFRTAPGVNLMVLDPPNYFHHNLANLLAVIETDNLRRDFTFNLKIIKPKARVRVKKGDIISGVIPIPRYFVDDFSIHGASEYFDGDAIAAEKEQVTKFGKLRLGEDKQKPQEVGKLYWRGMDADENVFEDHQRKLRPPGWSDAQMPSARKKLPLLKRLFGPKDG